MVKNNYLINGIMRRILTYSILIIGLIACKNQEIEFDDFDYNTVYFPIQLPLRTLSLGEDRIDNSLDKQFQFDIAASIGGMYKNKKSWTVDFIVDNSLTNNLFTLDDQMILPLPANYYTLNPGSAIIIPKGSFNGRVRIQLNDAFFDDPISLTGLYVIPLIITNTTADSILAGLPASGISNPDRRINTDWETGMEPKDWVLYGIKYINGYHGSYLQRGRRITFLGADPIDTVIYKNKHVENDNVVFLKSTGRTTVTTNFLSQNISSTGQYSMNLEFANMWGTPGGPVIITPNDGSLYAASGSGQFIDKANSSESIIGLTMQYLYINYTYEVDEFTYVVTDTLVFRDRDLKFETNSIVVH